MPRRHPMGGSGEDAIAYAWLMLLVFLILGSITYLSSMYFENSIMKIENKWIAEGKSSSQTVNAINFNRSIGMYLPVFMLLGAFIWAMLRGIGGRGDSGGGATYQAFYTGYVILVLCCLVGFIMSFLGGYLIDTLYTQLDKANMIQGTMITAEWNQAQQETMWGFINLYFGLCYIVPCIGAVVFFQAIVRKTQGSRYTQGGY